MKFREQLVNEFAGLLLDSVRNNGWLTKISDEVGINRRYFKPEGVANMRLPQLLRLLVGLCEHYSQRTGKGWLHLWTELGMMIFETADDHYDEFCSEHESKKKTSQPR